MVLAVLQLLLRLVLISTLSEFVCSQFKRAGAKVNTDPGTGGAQAGACYLVCCCRGCCLTYNSSRIPLSLFLNFVASAASATPWA